MIANTGRAIVRRLASREPILSPDRVVQLSYKPLRVINTSHTVSAFSSGLGRFANGVIISIARRSYATKPASRPKAHTGRTTSNPRKKATTTTKSVATKKPSAVKAKPKPKPKATAKPKTKPKPKAKPKAKPPPNRRLKKALTDKQATKAALQKERARTLELKTIALTTPKLLPASAYLVLSSEITKAGHGILGKETSAKYKELTAEQLEHYNHVANQNKVANEAAYKKWVLSHTVDEIRLANNARMLLKRRLKRPRAFTPIKDDRLVKRPATGYANFFKDRVTSGDLRHMTLAARSRLVAQEWRDLNSSEKKKYQDMAVIEMARYRQEVKTVYNREVSPLRKAAAAA